MPTKWSSWICSCAERSRSSPRFLVIFRRFGSRISRGSNTSSPYPGFCCGHCAWGFPGCCGRCHWFRRFVSGRIWSGRSRGYPGFCGGHCWYICWPSGRWTPGWWNLPPGFPGFCGGHCWYICWRSGRGGPSRPRNPQNCDIIMYIILTMFCRFGFNTTVDFLFLFFHFCQDYNF